MKSFKVKFYEQVGYYIEVEANDEDSARFIAKRGHFDGIAGYTAKKDHLFEGEVLFYDVEEKENANS